MNDTRAINRFLLANGIRIRENPAISPDLCLDPARLERAVRDTLPALSSLVRGAGQKSCGGALRIPASEVDFYPASELAVRTWRLFVVEHRETGDAGLLV